MRVSVSEPAYRSKNFMFDPPPGARSWRTRD